MYGRCGLCGKEKELQESHIIPSFVFKWLKESSITGHFRHGETINKRVQDGAKHYLLCWDCEQHLLPFRGLIGEHNDPKIPGNFNRYISRSVDIDAACSETEAYVYAKMCRILLIGFVKMDHRERWRDTKVHVNHGILEKRHYKVPATISHFMYYKACRLQEVHKNISDRQWKRIGKDYEKNSDKFQDSEMFKAITQDSILFGEAAFDD